MKKVILIGHCGPDSSYLRSAIARADRAATISQADDERELQKALGEAPALLVLNRLLDYGFAEQTGVELIARLRRTHPHVKSLLVSNYEDAQAAAIAAGALEGFGKRDIGKPIVTELLQKALAEPSAAPPRAPAAPANISAT